MEKKSYTCVLYTTSQAKTCEIERNLEERKRAKERGRNKSMLD